MIRPTAHGRRCRLLIRQTICQPQKTPASGRVAPADIDTCHCSGIHARVLPLLCHSGQELAVARGIPNAHYICQVAVKLDISLPRFEPFCQPKEGICRSDLCCLKRATKIEELAPSVSDWHFPRTLTITAEDLFGVAFKHTHKTRVSNAIAGTLLEGGFDIQWVSKTIEQLGSKVDHKDLTAVAGVPAGPKRLAAVIELCASRQIEVPASGTKEHHPNQSSKQPKHRKIQAPPDPSQYRLAAGYFLNEVNSECERIANFKPGATGIFLCCKKQRNGYNLRACLAVMNWPC